MKRPVTSHLGAAPATRPDSELLMRLAQGEIAALGELYDLYAQSLLRFVRRAAPGTDAEDIVQATFLRVVRIAGSFDPNAASARPWLFAIAARLIQERRRSVRRFSAALLGLARQPRSPSQQKSEHSGDFDKALDQLSEAKRVVLLLAEVDGFSCDEIAGMLKIPVGTVWTRLHHARRELRGFFKEGM